MWSKTKLFLFTVLQFHVFSSLKHVKKSLCRMTAFQIEGYTCCGALSFFGTELLAMLKHFQAESCMPVDANDSKVVELEAF